MESNGCRAPSKTSIPPEAPCFCKPGHCGDLYLEVLTHLKNACGDWHQRDRPSCLTRVNLWFINFPPTPPASVQLTLMLFDIVISSKTWDVHLTSTSPRCVTCVESYGRLATWRQNTCWFPPMHPKECSFVQPTPKQRESEGVGSLRNTYSSWKWEHAFWNIVVSNLRRYWYTPFEREQWKQRGQQFDRP